MIHTIRDENELPHTIGTNTTYIRCLLAPHVLVHCKAGDGYQRMDGAAWEWPGYKIDHDRDNGRVTRTPGSVFGDSKRNQP